MTIEDTVREWLNAWEFYFPPEIQIMEELKNSKQFDAIEWDKQMETYPAQFANALQSLIRMHVKRWAQKNMPNHPFAQ